jgi:starvation-inducible DNA-binding protein
MSKSKPSTAHVIHQLSVLLANTYALALKTQNYHWNVTGSEFYSLHKLFETQYVSLHNAVDTLAERIRALGSPAPGSFSEFLKLTSITEAKKNIPAKTMLGDLLKSNEAIVKQAYTVIQYCESVEDNATLDMVVGRIEEHQKQAWMLRSSLT